MLKKKRELNILRDKIFGWNIHGEVVKIHVKSKNLPMNARLQINTEEGEVLFNDFITNTIQNIYPKNIIVDRAEIAGKIQYVEIIKDGITFLEEVPSPPVIIESELSVEDYIIMGSIVFKITGLEEGERIDEVRLIYREEVERTGL